MKAYPFVCFALVSAVAVFGVSGLAHSAETSPTASPQSQQVSDSAAVQSDERRGTDEADLDGGGVAVTEAQQPPPSQTDLIVDPREPDFTIVNSPTTARVPVGKFAFRLTHRFSRPLDGFDDDFDFGDLLDDFFGFDSAAQIGLEFRFGLISGTQVGIHRTSEGRSPQGPSRD